MIKERLTEYIKDLKDDVKECKRRIKTLKEQKEIYGNSLPRLDYDVLIAKEEGELETLQSIIDVEEDILKG